MAGILLRVSCIFVADCGKIGLLGEDLLEVEPLVCRVLVNFLPDGDNGSYKWHKHDWQFEADYYWKHEVPIRVLF